MSTPAKVSGTHRNTPLLTLPSCLLILAIQSLVHTDATPAIAFSSGNTQIDAISAAPADWETRATSIRLFGYITDSVTSDAIPTAYVEIKDEDLSVIASTGVDAAGFYDLSVPIYSKYFICASDWGANAEYWLQKHLFACQTVIYQEVVEIQTDVSLQPTGNYILEAYDHDGQMLRSADFGSATGGYVFVTNPRWLPNASIFSSVHDAYSIDNGWDWNLAIPSFVAPTQTNNHFHIQWNIPAFGEVILELDNNGLGYSGLEEGEYLVINFNREAALSETARLERELDLFSNQGYSFSSAVETKLIQAETACAAGEADLSASPPDMTAAIQHFNDALVYALYGQESLYLEKAEADIPRYRRGTLNLTLRLADDESIHDATVEYRQTTHDFLFSTGYLSTDGWNYDPQLGDLMEAMGANGASVMLEHAVFEPQLGIFDWSFLDQYSGLNPLSEKDFNIMGALAYYGSSNQTFDCPSYWSGMSFTQYKAHLVNHFMNVASRYGARIGPWMINEPNLAWSNCLGLTWEQKLDVYQKVMDGLHAGHPQAQNLVASLAIPYSWSQQPAPPDLNILAEGVSFPIFLEWMQNRGVPLDNIGLEFHIFGVTVPPDSYPFPGMSLAALARLMDDYDAFGIPVWIEPFQVPSTQENGSAWWHRPWDEATQAEFAVKFYTLAFSREHFHDICWSDASDHNPFVISAGLIDSDYQPKPVYYALKDLIASWTTNGSAMTDENGQVSIQGYAGEYMITITTPQGRQFRTQVHLNEQQQTNLIITIHELFLPAVVKSSD